MKITYLVSAVRADRSRASLPLHLAADGSVEVGQDVSIVLGGDATGLRLGDAAEEAAAAAGASEPTCRKWVT